MSQERTEAQQAELGRVYDTIARALPSEGRDYLVYIKFNGTEPKPMVDLVPLTALGTVWTAHCLGQLRTTYKGAYAETNDGIGAAPRVAALHTSKRVL